MGQKRGQAEQAGLCRGPFSSGLLKRQTVLTRPTPSALETAALSQVRGLYGVVNTEA